MPEERVRKIDSLWTLVIATLFLGPLALPLLWRNPRFSAKAKVAGSLAIVLFTVALAWVSKVLLEGVLDDAMLLLQ